MTDSSNSAVQELSSKIKELISDASTDIIIINDVNEAIDDGIYIIDLPIFMQGKVNFINNSNQAVFNPPQDTNTDIEINWGDGTVDKGIQKTYTHTYADNTKTYNVVIKGDISAVQAGLFPVGFEEIELKKLINLVSGTFGQSSYILKKLILPYGINQLPTALCSNVSSLISVDIPNSIISIGDGCFDHCTSLTSIIIPNSVTSIGAGCFNGCTGLTSIIIPNSVTSIGNNCFKGCTSLTNIDISNSITSIGMEFFQNCSTLTSVNIPESVTSIGDRCFKGCTSLTSVNIPELVTNIGVGCFQNCSSLTSINIPDSVTNIGANCFDSSNMVDYQLYWEDSAIISYNSRIMPNYTNTMFTIPSGQKDNYIAKGYPSDKLIERDE